MEDFFNYSKSLYSTHVVEANTLMGFVFYVSIFGIFIKWYHWYFMGRHSDLGNEKKFKHHLLMACFILVGALGGIFLLASYNSEWGGILAGLFGVVLSGIIAFSSSTILANLAAGLLIRINRPFKTGDFIRIGDHFGRVSERGLFETEIQTEHRELIALPNTFCINNPVTTILDSGVILSVTLSLGYDVDHHRVEVLLKRAARKIGLEKPFVHILDLGDYSVSYRISGLLQDSKTMITARSMLSASVLDTFHMHGIEIMSPSFMNQKQLGKGDRSIPQTISSYAYPSSSSDSLEDIAFDKVNKAERMEELKQRIIQELEDLEDAKKESFDREESKVLEKKIELKQKGLVKIDSIIESIRAE